MYACVHAGVLCGERVYGYSVSVSKVVEYDPPWLVCRFLLNRTLNIGDPTSKTQQQAEAGSLTSINERGCDWG